jgi:hypothetical protein
MTIAVLQARRSFHSGYNIDMKRLHGFFILFFISAVVIAQTNGITKLPETYRTPLSDMVYEDLSEWRSEPEEENPWREKTEEPMIKPRLKVELFPKYNYDSLQNPVSDSLFQNQNEIERPVSNILEYKFK